MLKKLLKTNETEISIKAVAWIHENHVSGREKLENEIRNYVNKNIVVYATYTAIFITVLHLLSKLI